MFTQTVLLILFKSKRIELVDLSDSELIFKTVLEVAMFALAAGFTSLLLWFDFDLASTRLQVYALSYLALLVVR